MTEETKPTNEADTTGSVRVDAGVGRWLVSMKYLAMIQGGLGPDVWDREIEISAADFKDASEQALAQAREMSGQVTYLEQSE